VKTFNVDDCAHAEDLAGLFGECLVERFTRIAAHLWYDVTVRLDIPFDFEQDEWYFDLFEEYRP